MITFRFLLCLLVLLGISGCHSPSRNLSHMGGTGETQLGSYMTGTGGWTAADDYQKVLSHPGHF